MMFIRRMIGMIVFLTVLLCCYIDENVEAKEQVLRVAGDDSLPPFSYKNEQGKLEGFSVDLFNAIAEAQGMQVEYIPMDLAQSMEALKSGKIDAVIGMKYTAERDERFDFSEYYFTISESIVVPKDQDEIKYLTDLKGKLVAIQRNHVAFNLLQDVRRVHMNIAENQIDALELLMMGRADAFIGNKWTAQYYLEKHGKETEYKIIDDPIQPADYAVAVQGGNTDLIKEINHGLLTIRANGTYNDMYNKWFNEANSKMLQQMKSIVHLLISILAGAGLILIMGFVWNKRLKQEVMKQTKALKEAYQRLEQSRKEMANQGAFKEQILNNVPNGIVTFDVNWHVTSMNKEAQAVLLTDEEWQNHSIIKEAFQNYVNEREEQISGEVEFTQNGKAYFMYYHLRPLLNINNEKTGFLLIFENRTEEKKLHEKLVIQEKMRAIGQLSAGIAHEIRNPLTSIKTFVELLPIKYDNPSFREAIKEHVPSEINRLNQIIEDLLDYSRPKAPKKELCNVREWLDSIFILFEPTLRKENIDFSINVDEELTIYADKQQLKQVLVNMILNAIDAMKEQEIKRLKISAFANEQFTIIQIEDTGRGMTKQEIEKCYDPFFTTKPTGVGLGMTISLKLVKENGGDIEMESLYGKGTTIQIILPRSIEKEGES